jgi:GDP-4-dehydro-6-deoxy-D-mannose reductase
LNVLITGAAGFVGTHLVDFLRTVPGYTLHGAVLEKPSTTDSPTDSHSEPYTPWVVDLRDEDAVRSVLEQIKPERIYHLAGQAYIPLSFDEPWDTLETNIRGTLTILQAVKTLKLDTRILVVGSAEIYGAAAVLPITEETPFLPSSPYSVSKIAQDMLAWQFYRAHKLHTIRVRPFNHIGPGQNARFAVADWAQQIVAAERGEREAVVSVGNLSAARDFTDVRDVVRAGNGKGRSR